MTLYTRPLTVLVVDPMPGVVAGLRWVLAAAADVAVVAEAGSIAAARAAPAADVVLTGLLLPDGSAADLARVCPAPVVVHTWLPADERDPNLTAGVAAVVAHGRLRADLAAALRAVCCNARMADPDEPVRVVTASREIAAAAEKIFELIADPAQQPRWDGNDNLAEAPPGQRVTAVGDVFTMTLSRGSVRHNHVVEFAEGRRIAWRPAEPDTAPPGHLWRWELEPLGPSRTLVTHTYDWTELRDETRVERARWTTPERLQASLERLAEIAERS